MGKLLYINTTYKCHIKPFAIISLPVWMSRATRKTSERWNCWVQEYTTLNFGRLCQIVIQREHCLHFPVHPSTGWYCRNLFLSKWWKKLYHIILISILLWVRHNIFSCDCWYFFLWIQMWTHLICSLSKSS